MTPDQVDDLSDVMWAAMVDRMMAEANAIKAASAKIPRS